MEFKELTEGRFNPPSAPGTPVPVSTGNPQQSQQSLLPREPYTPPYQKGEVDPNRVEEFSAYLPYGRRYVKEFGIQIALSLQQALEQRRRGLAVVTLREADIAARCKIPLSNEFLHKALQAIDGMIVEGTPGEKDNPYFLREFYNRGVKFKIESYHKALPEQQRKADAAMQEVLDKLEKMNLPAWPEEVIAGFKFDICKPEFMTWDQYREAAKHYVSRDPESFGEQNA